jgi:hypothetical protein
MKNMLTILIYYFTYFAFRISPQNVKDYYTLLNQALFATASLGPWKNCNDTVNVSVWFNLYGLVGLVGKRNLNNWCNFQVLNLF